MTPSEVPVSDLVARLRTRARFNPSKPNNVRLFGDAAARLHCEAADELSRLAAENEALRADYKKLYDSTERRERDALVTENAHVRAALPLVRRVIATVDTWNADRDKPFERELHT